MVLSDFTNDLNGGGDLNGREKIARDTDNTLRQDISDIYSQSAYICLIYK
jgi:hypothetical protein